jgi:hypothetical protein
MNTASRWRSVVSATESGVLKQPTTDLASGKSEAGGKREEVVAAKRALLNILGCGQISKRTGGS